MAIELTQEIDRRITAITEDTRETTFLFPRLPIALQRENAVSFHNTGHRMRRRCNHLILLSLIGYASNPLLRRFDDTLRTGLINILNVDLKDD